MDINTKNKWGDKWGDKILSKSQIKVLAEIRNNPNITISQLAVVCNLGRTTIDRSISKLKEMGYIKRVGANKNGYWEIIK
ncbi:MAG TPA: winged helix-turn-helix transcriptional regulator [Erysipelotrichaceae bacterium]|nr:winged helix-turn-helix transcriptional regulator [Erysipelotrichaceae bacterium]